MVLATIASLGLTMEVAKRLGTEGQALMGDMANTGITVNLSLYLHFHDLTSTGDIIGTILDADAKTISYYRNGKDMGVAFSNVNIGDGLYPAASLQKRFLSFMGFIYSPKLHLIQPLVIFTIHPLLIFFFTEISHNKTKMLVQLRKDRVSLFSC